MSAATPPMFALWRGQARWIILLAGTGLLIIVLTFLPWMEGAGELGPEFTQNTVRRAIGYRNSGDRAVLRLLGGLLTVLALVWLLRRAWGSARLLIAATSLLAAAWASLPLFEMGTLRDLGSDGIPASVGVGPVAVLIVSMASAVIAIGLRPGVEAAESSAAAAQRSAARGRPASAVVHSERALRLIQRTHGSRDPRTLDAAEDYAVLLEQAGYGEEARFVWERLRERRSTTQ
ncbi:hypothetical protein QL996_00155 [Planococcus sp. APC 4015]|nr:hypothetical protein [Planococcus sp. APC 4015]